MRCGDIGLGFRVVYFVVLMVKEIGMLFKLDFVYD